MLRSVLVWTLSFQISLSPTLSWGRSIATTTQEFQTAAKIANDLLAEISSRLNDLHLQTRNPGTRTAWERLQAKENGYELISEIEDIESELQKTRNAVEKSIQTALEQFNDQALELKRRNIIIPHYLSLWYTLGLARAYLSLPYKPSDWKPNLDIRIPEASVKQLSFGDSLITVQEGEDGYYMISLAPENYESIRLAALANTPSESSLFEITHFHVKKLLQTERERIHFLLQKESNDSLKRVRAELHEETCLKKLSKELSNPKAFKPYFTVEIAEALFKLLDDDSKKQYLNIEKYADHIIRFEKSTFSQSIKLLLAQSQVPLSEISLETFGHLVRQLFFDAQKLAVNPIFIEVPQNVDVSELLPILQKRQNDFMGIPSDNWLEESWELCTSPEKQTEFLAEQYYEKSKIWFDIVTQQLNEAPFDLQVFKNTLTPLFENKIWSKETQNWVALIFDQPDPNKALTYSEISQRMKQVQLLLKKQSFASQQVRELREISKILKLEKLGTTKSQPSFSEVDLKGEWRNSYQRELERQLFKSPDDLYLASTFDTKSGRKLYEQLNQVDGDDAREEFEAFLNAQLNVVNKAIRATEDAKNSESFSVLLGRSEFLKELIQTQFPSLKTHQKRHALAEAQRKTQKGYFEIFTEEYTRPFQFFFPAFVIEIALPFLRSSHPLSGVFQKYYGTFRPWIEGYLLSAAPIIGFEIYHQVSDYQEVAQLADDLDSIHSIASIGPTLVNHFDVTYAKTEAEEKITDIQIELAVLGTFVMGTALAPVLKQSFLTVENLWVISKLKKVGIKPGEFHWTTKELGSLPGKEGNAVRNFFERKISGADHAIYDLRDELQTLGLSYSRQSLNPQKLFDAFSKKEVAFQKGLLPASEWIKVQNANDRIGMVIQSQIRWLYGDKVRFFVSNNPVSDMRMNVHYKVFGYRLHKSREMTVKEAYQILKSRENDPIDKIRLSHRDLVKKFHPDVHPNDNGDKFRQIQEAWKKIREIRGVGNEQ